jgi:hypothetical protein
MSRFSSGYPLGRPTRRCAITQRDLAIGEQYIATLQDDGPANPPRRVDYSEDAWRSAPAAGRPRGVLAFWRAHVHTPGQTAPKHTLDDATLSDLFEQTEQGISPLSDLPTPGAEGVAPAAEPNLPAPQRHLALRFVLALLMMRRRLLVLESTRPGLMLVRHRGVPKPPEGPALIEVIDPGVDESTIISVIAELEGDGDTGAAASTPAGDTQPATQAGLQGAIA